MSAEAFITRQDSVREESSLFIQETRDCMSVRSGTEGANVEFIQVTDIFKELFGKGPKPSMVPRGIGSMQSEMKHILQTSILTMISCFSGKFRNYLTNI